MENFYSSIPVILSIIAIFISLNERKRSLSSVVYEKQIQACYELITSFSQLEKSFHGWIDLKEKGYHVHSVPYPQQTSDSISQIYMDLRGHFIVLPSKFLNEFTTLMYYFLEEHEKMCDDIKYLTDKNEIYDKMGVVQNRIRKEFGIEKLSASNRSILGIPPTMPKPKK